MLTKWYLVQAKYWRAPYWLEDRDEGYWHNINGGKTPKDKKDKIFDTAKVENYEDLDWSRTGLLQKQEDCGWLGRDGKWYGCEYRNHENVAYLILKQTESILEKTGWCRVWRAPNPRAEAWKCLRRLSAEQRNWLSFRGHLVTDDD